MRYILTGNFQYDLGIYGLKKVLDFFEEDYETDGKFYIEIDKQPEEILELVVLKLICNKGSNYFLEKVAGTLLKNNKEAKKEYRQLTKEKPINLSIDLENIIKREKSLEKILEFLAAKINLAIKNIFQAIQIPVQENYIKEMLWNKSIDLLNNILLNFQADKVAKGKTVLEKAIEKLYKDTDEKQICSFCHQEPGKRITRDTFFFAPAQFNAFWFNEPSIFICPYCLASNLAITQAFTFLNNELNAVVVYRPNIEDLESLNTGLKISDIGELTQKIIEYEKLVLKREATTKDLQILECYLDSKNPNLEFYLLTDKVLKSILKIEEELNKLYTTYKTSLWGQIKDKTGYKTISLSKELLKFLSQNQKLSILVQKFAKLALMSESYRNKNVKNPPVKGFYINVLLEFLKMHFKLEEDLNMDMFNAFKEYGQVLRGRVYSQLSEGGNINWNTFDNKIISLANSFLNASKGNLNQFMETLTRVMISYNAPIDTKLLNLITPDTYKDIATTIALAVITKKPGEIKENREPSEEITEDKAL